MRLSMKFSSAGCLPVPAPAPAAAPAAGAGAAPAFAGPPGLEDAGGGVGASAVETAAAAGAGVAGIAARTARIAKMAGRAPAHRERLDLLMDSWLSPPVPTAR